MERGGTEKLGAIKHQEGMQAGRRNEGGKHGQAETKESENTGKQM